MILGKTRNFDKQFQKLPPAIQKKVIKQIGLLEQDFFHPSLNTKRLTGYPDWWEFRVDRHYRMSGKKTEDALILHVVGMHDVGLGKK